MIAQGRGAAGAALASRNWERVLYLTNLTTIVLTVAIYLFALFDPTNMRRLVMVLIGYGASFLVWTLLDGLGLADRSSLVAHLFEAPGLDWMDACLALLSLLVLFAAWRLGRLSEAIAIVAGLTVFNGVLGYFQVRSRYAQETMSSLYSGSSDQHPAQHETEDTPAYQGEPGTSSDTET